MSDTQITYLKLVIDAKLASPSPLRQEVAHRMLQAYIEPLASESEPYVFRDGMLTAEAIEEWNTRALLGTAVWMMTFDKNLKDREVRRRLKLSISEAETTTSGPVSPF
jgi:hypothetical protein